MPNYEDHNHVTRDGEVTDESVGQTLSDILFGPLDEQEEDETLITVDFADVSPERYDLLQRLLGIEPDKEEEPTLADSLRDEITRPRLDVPDGSVVRYVKRFAGVKKLYRFVAIHYGGFWYTSDQNRRRVAHRDFIQELSSEEVREVVLMEDGEQIL